MAPRLQDPALAPTVACRAVSDAAALPPGTLIAGQYRVLAPLGAGGMGVVYRAHDQRLDREVALKLCRASSPRGTSRFEREAHALARLAHPSVVTAYQSGEHEGWLFIAMEVVAGGTARSWVAGRSWREIVALYAAAGEGLAAAHAAGIVHRDFTPDNVLVGDDGRPRVADFGLAHAAADLSGEIRALGSGEVTVAGTVLGTLAYMAPEQRAGRPVDARADQYAFCAALWEALFEELPYSNPGAASSEEVRTGPRARALGGARRRRGAAPGDRWPSMTALIAELRRDPGVRRRRSALVAGGVAAALLAGAAAVMALRPGEPASCTDSAARLAPVWSPERAAVIAEAVEPAAWASLAPALGAYADAWIAGHAEICRAGRAAASAASGPGDAVRRREVCLARSRAELDGFLAELTEYPRQAPALEAFARITPPAACAVIAGSADAEAPPPADPAALGRIERAARMLARAQTALLAGMQARGALLTNDALVLARLAGFRPQLAQALVVRAGALADSGRPAEARGALEEAMAIAITERSDATAATASARLAELLAADGRADEARRMLATARSLWERRREPALGDLLAGAEVQVALAGGRLAEAVAGARARAQAQADREPPELAAASAAALGQVLLAAGAEAEAAGVVERGIAATEQRLGPLASALPPALAVLVAARLRLGQRAAALEAARRAVAGAERAGADGTRLSEAYAALGEASRATGDLAAARSAFERALRIEEAMGPGRRSEVAQAAHNLALVEVAAGDLASAGARGAVALATLETIHGADRPILIPALVLLGHVARARGELAVSEAHLRRAAAIAARRLGPDHPDALNIQIELASTQLAAGRPGEAIALLEPIVRGAAPPASAAEARFALARALAATPGDRRRARSLAVDALARYRALGAPTTSPSPEITEIERWLARDGR